MIDIKKIYKEAKELGMCSKFEDMFKQVKTVSDLLQVFLTPEGVDFCIEHNFPDMQTMRLIPKEEACKQGVYIDTNIKLKNPGKLVLIGNTKAELDYDNLDERHEVVLMHGAKAEIKASKYAVVFVTKGGGEVKEEVKDYAKIL